MTRMKELYEKEVAPALMKKFEYKSPMQIPKIEKIVVNMGVGEAKDNSKALDSAASDMEKIVTMLMRRIRASSDVSMEHALQVQRAHGRRGEHVPLDIPLRGGIGAESEIE